MTASGDRRIEQILREEAPQVLGALVRRFGRFAAAEDATQEALLSAHTAWRTGGIPDEPRSWLIRVGYRKLVDLLRSEDADRRREQEWVADRHPDPLEAGPDVIGHDDSLQLLLLCCHPALSDASRIALTLRAVGGLTTVEIARAYGVSESTMATRISRAKRSLHTAGARFALTDADDARARLAAVCRVLYLIFNEGYTATAGPALHRVDLSEEAIRMTRMLARTVPDDAEVQGLLALMLLTEARRDARQQGDRLVLMEDQDRALWSAPLVEEGCRLIEAVWSRGEVGVYQIQAAIAAVHAQAAGEADTDWPQIAALYLWLERLEPTAPVRLSRVVAVARAFGAHRGLALLDDLDARHALMSDPLATVRAHSVRAHLLHDLGRHDEAREHFQAAAALATNEVEKRYLTERAAGDR